MLLLLEEEEEEEEEEGGRGSEMPSGKEAALWLARGSEYTVFIQHSISNSKSKRFRLN